MDVLTVETAEILQLPVRAPQDSGCSPAVARHANESCRSEAGESVAGKAKRRCSACKSQRAAAVGACCLRCPPSWLTGCDVAARPPARLLPPASALTRLCVHRPDWTLSGSLDTPAVKGEANTTAQLLHKRTKAAQQKQLTANQSL